MKSKEVRVVIKTTPEYGRYLVWHLQLEHPKTKGNIQIKK